MEETDALLSLAALAHGARLRLFRALVEAGPGGRQPGMLAALLGIAPATLSFHLKELHRAGLASVERHGRFLVYRARFERVDALLAFLTANCCAGAPCAVTPRATPAAHTC